MNSLKSLLANPQIHNTPLPLFAKLREIKRTQRGLGSVQSHDGEDGQEDAVYCQLKDQIQKFKQEKALQIVGRHERTQQSIDSIVESIKNQLKYQAIGIIQAKYKGSTQKLNTNKQSGSTVPSSSYKQQTPGFDQPPSASRSHKPIHEFTLGQRQESNSSTRQCTSNESLVSEFKVPASYKIKQRVMNTPKSTV